MIYLPSTDYACIVVYNSETLRAYSTLPAQDTTVSYTDYYINSHYISKTGSETFSRYSATLPTCLSSDSVTTDFYYRNDLPDILLMFTIFCIFCFLIPLKIFTRIFRRYL